MKRELLIGITLLVIIASGLAIYRTSSSGVVKVFHAGSLSQPFEKINEENNSFNLQREPSGSVEVMRKVTELGKKPDIVAVSDYSLIPDYLIPEYTDWYVQFARNEIVIAYSSESAYSSEIDENNWFKILGRSDVKFAFGDPNADPGGYRAMMTIQLAENYYDNSRIFDDLIAANTAMVAPTLENGVYTLEAIPLEELSPNTSKVQVGSMEVAVIPALEEGSVDYMFNYRSIAKQHNFQFVELPSEINLSKVKYAENYARARVKLSDGKTKSGKPIVYGATMLRNAEHEEASLKFLRYLLSDGGRGILEDMGQPPINPPIVNSLDNVPSEIRDLVSEYAD
ncbi:hypothetical protein AKJ47_01005 [candidate division MSBL1 archaeon SCGC-AAA261G05]|uniref:Tungstate ABC transporter substrate-binding protein WtpA n=2 Tax=candidate division MSBL1 TaxID=215777 RepID=A0A133V284_9EURY|nr:hypothetical protein AKJ42_00295 [candidate division MSBL1 archaeon SCGC-AAA261C02]KXB04014.1 hypothetical protein AKJ47_01005 [candidate division MSBL1 archaeon SCGC-AAA261G05]